MGAGEWLTSRLEKAGFLDWGITENIGTAGGLLDSSAGGMLGIVAERRISQMSEKDGQSCRDIQNVKDAGYSYLSYTYLGYRYF
jgi:hypothetical protein